MTRVKKPTGFPTRSESDLVVDEMLEGSPLVSDVLDRDARDDLKTSRYELRSLEALVALDPHKKTPAVSERLDTLRKDYRERLGNFGLDPASRRSLGLSTGALSLGAQNRGREPDEVVLAYRRPKDHEAFLKRLVQLGVWDTEGARIKAELEDDGQSIEDTEAISERTETRVKAKSVNGRSPQTKAKKR
jgi:hypothetical protein